MYLYLYIYIYLYLYIYMYMYIYIYIYIYVYIYIGIYNYLTSSRAQARLPLKRADSSPCAWAMTVSMGCVTIAETTPAVPPHSTACTREWAKVGVYIRIHIHAHSHISLSMYIGVRVHPTPAVPPHSTACTWGLGLTRNQHTLTTKAEHVMSTQTHYTS